jgi:pilus assembly protein Flp/PilA
MSAAAAYVLTIMFTVQRHFEGRRERGATAVEYGLMVGLIAVAIIVAVGLLGTKLTDLFSGVATKLPTPAP